MQATMQNTNHENENEELWPSQWEQGEELVSSLPLAVCLFPTGNLVALRMGKFFFTLANILIFSRSRRHIHRGQEQMQSQLPLLNTPTSSYSVQKAVLQSFDHSGYGGGLEYYSGDPGYDASVPDVV